MRLASAPFTSFGCFANSLSFGSFFVKDDNIVRNDFRLLDCWIVGIFCGENFLFIKDRFIYLNGIVVLAVFAFQIAGGIAESFFECFVEAGVVVVSADECDFF